MKVSELKRLLTRVETEFNRFAASLEDSSKFEAACDKLEEKVGTSRFRGRTKSLRLIKRIRNAFTCFAEKLDEETTENFWTACDRLSETLASAK